MVTPVETTMDGITPGKERSLPHPEFSALLGWDISPDGQRFVVVGRLATAMKPGGSTSTSTTTTPNRVEIRVPEIRVVTGLFEELREER